MKKIISGAVKNRNNPDWKLEVGNIDVKRDFGYSPKYVEAMWLILQQETSRDFIICSGESISLRAIIQYVFKKLAIAEDKITISENLFRPVDIEDIYGDNSLAKDILEWNYDMSFFDVLDILIDEEIKYRHA